MLLFLVKKYGPGNGGMDGWMGGRMDGWMVGLV